MSQDWPDPTCQQQADSSHPAGRARRWWPTPDGNDWPSSCDPCDRAVVGQCWRFLLICIRWTAQAPTEGMAHVPMVFVLASNKTITRRDVSPSEQTAEPKRHCQSCTSVSGLFLHLSGSPYERDLQNSVSPTSWYKNQVSGDSCQTTILTM